MERLANLCARFSNTADGVWASGPDGRILFWNRGAEAILKYPAQHAVGQLCRELFAGCDRNGNRICTWPCPIKTLINSGELVQHFEMATRTRTGKPVWLDVSCLAIPAEDDRPPIVIHLFRDVTVAHQVEGLVREQLAQKRLATSDEGLILNGELTQRELEVVSRLRAGATTAGIAEQLLITKATVRNHIQNIFSKLGVHTRLEAVAYVNQIARREATAGADGGTSR